MRKNLNKLILKIFRTIFIISIIIAIFFNNFSSIRFTPWVNLDLKLVIYLSFFITSISIIISTMKKLDSIVLKVVFFISYISILTISFLIFIFLFLDDNYEEKNFNGQSYVITIYNDYSTGLHHPTNTYKYYRKINYFFMNAREEYTHIKKGRNYDVVVNMSEEKDKEIDRKVHYDSRISSNSKKY